MTKELTTRDKLQQKLNAAIDADDYKKAEELIKLIEKVEASPAFNKPSAWNDAVKFLTK